jgi:hypothetical protein
MAVSCWPAEPKTIAVHLLSDGTGGGCQTEGLVVSFSGRRAWKRAKTILEPARLTTLEVV